ncbi:hypothetical protein LPJ61_005740, partial [Coemansia biformis]
MGLREKTDVDLQLISLGCAVLTLLVLVVARRYTADWRERRGFRRHLAATHRRLTQGTEPAHDQVSVDATSPPGRARRRWKRFIAAAPLVPLATAYVVARIGWDVFEVLVFCSIDLLRDASAGAVSAIQALARATRGYTYEAWGRLDVSRRVAFTVVAVIEGSVGWLFTVG